MNDHTLLVMYKPAGCDRICTPDEVSSVVATWNAVLRWLRGDEVDHLPEHTHVAYVIQQATLRALLSPEYDIRAWHACAVGVPCLNPPDTAMPVPDLGALLLRGLGLEQLRSSRHWLNRVAIEMVYGRSSSFQNHREQLIQRLLDGPVRIELWAGDQLPLVHATKLIFRRILGGTTGITNLIHVDQATAEDIDRLAQACSIVDRDE